MNRHVTTSSGDLAVTLTNLTTLIHCALDNLHDVGRQAMDSESVFDLDRAIALLTLGSEAARFTVDAYEHTDRQRLHQMKEAAKGGEK